MLVLNKIILLLNKITYRSTNKNPFIIPKKEKSALTLLFFYNNYTISFITLNNIYP